MAALVAATRRVGGMIKRGKAVTTKVTKLKITMSPFDDQLHHLPGLKVEADLSQPHSITMVEYF